MTDPRLLHIHVPGVAPGLLHRDLRWNGIRQKRRREDRRRQQADRRRHRKSDPFFFPHGHQMVCAHLSWHRLLPLRITAALHSCSAPLLWNEKPEKTGPNTRKPMTFS